MLKAFLSFMFMIGAGFQAPAQKAAVCADKSDCPGWFAHLRNHEGGHCSSFLLKPDVIATNRHCMPDDVQNSKDSCKGKITFHFPEGSNFKAETRDCEQVIDISEKFGDEYIPLDIAILRLAKPVEREVLDLVQTGAADNAPLTIVKMDPTSDGGIIRRVSCKAIQNSVINPYFQNNQSPILHFQGCKIIQGNSGSPILNAAGAVVGIVSNLSMVMTPDSIEDDMGKLPANSGGHGTNFSCLNTFFLGFNKGYDPACKVKLDDKFREDLKMKLLTASAEPFWEKSQKLMNERLEAQGEEFLVPFNPNILVRRQTNSKGGLTIVQTFEITPRCARWGSLMNHGAKNTRVLLKNQVPEVETTLDEHYRFVTWIKEAEQTLDLRWNYEQIRPGKNVNLDWVETGRFARSTRYSLKPCTAPAKMIRK